MAVSCKKGLVESGSIPAGICIGWPGLIPQECAAVAFRDQSRVSSAASHFSAHVHGLPQGVYALESLVQSKGAAPSDVSLAQTQFSSNLWSHF